MKQIASFIITREHYMTNPFLVYVDKPELIKPRILFVSGRYLDKYLKAIETNDVVTEALFANIEFGRVQTLQRDSNNFEVTIYAQDNTTDNSTNPS